MARPVCHSCVAYQQDNILPKSLPEALEFPEGHALKRDGFVLFASKRQLIVCKKCIVLIIKRGSGEP